MTDPNTPPPPAYPVAPPVDGAPAPGAPVPGKTLGIVALVLAFFFQLLGLILGIVALVQSRKVGARNLPAVWAIILSAVFLVVGTVVIAILVSIGIGAAADLYERCLELGAGTHTIDGVAITCG